MRQLELFQGEAEYPLHGYANKEEHDEDLAIWFEVMQQNEKEHDEELQIWFEIMEAHARDHEIWEILNQEAEERINEELENDLYIQWALEQDQKEQEEYEQEMFEYMDWVNEKEQATLLRDNNNGAGVAKKRRSTGSRNKRQQQMLSRKLHACNRQANGLK